jgi:hypothetical protein
VDIHLGPPDGILEGTVVDRDTGAVVPFARIAIRWKEDPSVFRSEGISRTGHFLYALPDRPISIEITAPGYQPWIYTNPSTYVRFIELKSTDHQAVKIELERIESNQGPKP